MAGLPAAARAQPEFSGLCTSALAFATAVLRHRLEDAASLRLLRRFLAAFLPPQADEDDGAEWRP